MREPLWPIASPQRQDLAADVITSQPVERRRRAGQPVRLDARIVVGGRDDLSCRGPDAGIDRRIPALFGLEQVMQWRGKDGRSCSTTAFVWSVDRLSMTRSSQSPATVIFAMLRIVSRSSSARL
jgi:hypothetical protein